MFFTCFYISKNPPFVWILFSTFYISHLLILFLHSRSDTVCPLGNVFTQISYNSRVDTICPCGKSILENFNILTLSPFDNAVFIFLNLSVSIVQWVTYRKTILCFILSLPSVHHLNTREYFYIKILSTSRVQHLNSSKHFHNKK